MEDTKVIVAIIAGIVAIAGGLIGMWTKFRRKSDGIGGARSVNVGRDVHGPVVTGDQSTTAGQLGVVLTPGYTGPITVVQQGSDADSKSSLVRIEQKLDAVQETLARPPAGMSPVDTSALAAEATPRTEELLDEALRLQHQHKHREAIDCLYEAFRKELEPRAKAQLHVLLGNSFLNISELEEAEGEYRQALDLS